MVCKATVSGYREGWKRWYRSTCLAAIAGLLAGTGMAGPLERDERAGQSARLARIHTFDEVTEGFGFNRPLVASPDGRLYGFATFGGPTNRGTFFRMSTHGHVAVLHAFTDNDGLSEPQSLLLSADGSFYGIGRHRTNGHGVLFRLSPHGKLTVLYRGLDDGSDCFAPTGHLMQARDGDFYQTNRYGADGLEDGCVVRISPRGQATVMHRFAGDDGAWPERLVESGDGHFYGITIVGGKRGDGTFFRMDRDGSVKVLHHFHEPSDGLGPRNLIEATDGLFYGTTPAGGPSRGGTAFRLTRDGEFTLLHDFVQELDGRSPYGIIQGADGDLYGMTSRVSKRSVSTIYRLARDGLFSVLYELDPAAKEWPTDASMTQMPDGRLYYVEHSRGRKVSAYRFRFAP